MATRYVALKYMSGFRCIGPACEDHCCGGWTIPVDKAHHDKLHALLTSLGEEARFAQAMQAPPGERSNAMFAVLAQNEQGNCHFLAEDRSCEIHGKHGDEYLGDVCATYPRRISRAGARLEITASVSCPEVARLALLADDATDLLACEPALAGRGGLAQVVPSDPPDPYQASLDLIRGTMFGLLTRREYSMRSRLFFLATFGERLASFLVEDTATADRNRLIAEIRTIEAPETLARLEVGFREGGGATALALAVVVQVMSTRLEKRASQTFRKLFTDVMKGFATADSGVTLDGGDVDSASVSPDKLAAYLDGRRDAREALLGERLDVWLENYCRNWVMHDWYVFAPSVALHVQRLLVKVAMVRLLLLNHPGLEAAAAAGPDALDRLAVEVFYSQARTMEHSDAAVNKIIDAMVGDAPPLAVALALLQI